MIFDGRPIAEIDDDEFAALVEDQQPEDQHLEFKALYHRDDDRSRLDLLKEIAALANGGGGYVIVGIEDVDSRACGFVGANRDESERDASSLLDLCLDHISPRIEGLEVVARLIGENGITVVRIPPSIRTPHMVTYQRGTHFIRRVADSKREMSHEEIRSAFQDEPVSRKVSEIDGKVGRLIEATERDATFEWLEDRVRTGGPGLTETADGEIIARLARKRFEDQVADSPYYWIAATPLEAQPGSIPVEDDDLRELLRDPPGSRRDGWNMEAIRETVHRTGEGLRRGDRKSRYLEITENGHLEFWTPLDAHFCWGQSEEEFQSRPRLNPFPLVEYPVTFLRLYRTLSGRYAIDGDVLFQYEYRNLRGYVLRPFHPRSIRYMAMATPDNPYEGDHFALGPSQQANDFHPEQLALELLQPLYGAFGFEPWMIPFFDEEDEKFVFG